MVSDVEGTSVQMGEVRFTLEEYRTDVIPENEVQLCFGNWGSEGAHIHSF